MTVYVSAKSIRQIHKSVNKIPFYLERSPRTLRELITESVRTSLCAFEVRGNTTEVPMTEAQAEEMRYVGKFAFGISYNENKPSEKKAIQAALDAVSDGLVRIFLGTEELTGLDAPLQLSEGDHLTFVRLTMLAGRMW